MSTPPLSCLELSQQVRPSRKTPLWQPKRGLDVLISRHPRQAGIPIKPWIRAPAVAANVQHKTSVLRWILCSKKLSSQVERAISFSSKEFDEGRTNCGPSSANTRIAKPSQRLKPYACCKPGVHASNRTRAARKSGTCKQIRIKRYGYF